jgi:hypothetical protein
VPGHLRHQDRRFAIMIAGISAMVVALAALILKADSGAGTLPSSYSSGATGAKAAFLLLQETGYNVRRSIENPRFLESVEANTTLVLADPVSDSEADILAVRSFVARGGRVVGTGFGVGVFFKGNHATAGVPHFDWTPYRPNEPSDLTRGVREIQMSPQSYFKGNDGDEAPFKNGSEIPVTRFQYGKGEVVWWSTSEPLSNAGLGRADNFQLLLNSIGEREGRQVLWDEYFHQGSKTVLDTFFNTPLRWGAIQCALIAALVCFSWSRRFGPVRAMPQSSRLAQMEFVETLGQLYQKSGAGNIAVEVVYQRFRTRVQQRFSVRRDAPIDQTATSLAPRLSDTDETELAQLLHELENAVNTTKLSPQRTTELIQKLHGLSKELGFISEDQTWKH